MKGHGEKLGRKKEQAILALVTTRNTEEAAKSIGVSAKTLLRWQMLRRTPQSGCRWGPQETARTPLAFRPVIEPRGVLLRRTPRPGCRPGPHGTPRTAFAFRIDRPAGSSQRRSRLESTLDVVTQGDGLGEAAEPGFHWHPDMDGSSTGESQGVMKHKHCKRKLASIRRTQNRPKWVIICRFCRVFWPS